MEDVILGVMTYKGFRVYQITTKTKQPIMFSCWQPIIFGNWQVSNGSLWSILVPRRSALNIFEEYHFTSKEAINNQTNCRHLRHVQSIYISSTAGCPSNRCGHRKRDFHMQFSISIDKRKSGASVSNSSLCWARSCSKGDLEGVCDSNLAMYLCVKELAHREPIQHHPLIATRVFVGLSVVWPKS